MRDQRPRRQTSSPPKQISAVCKGRKTKDEGSRTTKVHPSFVKVQRRQMETIRVLIADDHHVYRDGLRTPLDSPPEAEVVGEAAKGEEAVNIAVGVQPDVILMDLQMPGINGIEAT